MPSKKRIAREKARAREEAELDALVRQRPSHIGGKKGPIKNQFDAATEAARGYPLGLVQFEENGDSYRHEKAGKGGNDRRHAEMWEEIDDLKRWFPEIWHKRGSARDIAPKTADILGIEKNRSIRTIQKYQRLDKKRNARPR